MSEKLLLIDGHSMLNRAFYGLPDLTNTEGLHTGAVYGFLKIMLKTLEEEKPDYLAVAFDLHAPTFRHKMYDQYKGTRKPMPEELRQQVPLIKEMLAAMGIPIVTQEGYEADDILGTLARTGEREGRDVTILSGDRDLLQLCTDHVKIRMPKTSKGNTTVEDYYAPDVLEKYQVTPPQIIELKALMGDSSDNIPGIPGVGEKTAARIIGQFGTIENAYANVEEVKPPKARESLKSHYDMALLSKKLATIDTAAPVSLDMESAALKNLFTDEAYALCRRLDFNNLLELFGQASHVDEDTQSLETSFFTIEDQEGAAHVFERAGAAPQVGLCLLAEGQVTYGLGISLSEDENYYLAVGRELEADELYKGLRGLAERTLLCAVSVKPLVLAAGLPDDCPVFDAGVAAYLINPLLGSYPYEALARDYLGGRILPAGEELLGKKGLAAAWDKAAENFSRYACCSAYTAAACRENLTQKLTEQGMLDIYEQIELPLIFTLAGMERQGIRVQAEELISYGKQLQVRIGELEQEIYEMAGEEFNLNSPKQLGVILFEKMGLPGGKKTKTGYSTAADILEKLAEDQPVVRSILEYRQLAKLKSTYADGLAGQIAADGRIHTTFNQTITATGRISSTEPNLQNIPVRIELGRLIRKVFVPADGFVFTDADYSQIELRVLAHMSGDEKLIQAYREAQDIHRLTASQVFHVPFDEVTALQRRNAKAVNFGIVYGISSFGLSQDLSISRKEAQEYIEKYFQTYPGIRSFLNSLVEQGKKEGYVSTMYGRRRPIPELASGNFMQRSFGERVAMNSPIQGTAADIIKIAMNRVDRRLKKEELRSRLLLQVHDELLVETAADEREKVARILAEEMQGAAQLSVELEIDMHEGATWYDAK